MKNTTNSKDTTESEKWINGNPPRKSKTGATAIPAGIIKEERQRLLAKAGPISLEPGSPEHLVSDLEFKEKENFQRILKVLEIYHSREFRKPTQIELSEELGCSQSKISNLLRQMKRKRILDPDMGIIGKIIVPLKAHTTRRIPFCLEDGSYSGTDRIPVEMLIGSDRGDFKFFSWLVEEGFVTPDIIERGVRTDDLAIFRIQETAAPGDVILSKKSDPDPEKAPKLVLSVADSGTQFVLAKVVSVMREGVTYGNDSGS